MLAGIALLGGAGPLAGCATTQQKAARLQLSSARLRAEQVTTTVRHRSTTVRASSISLLREGKRTAFVVTVTNTGKHAVSDLPILVGYRGNDGGDVLVNGTVGADYADSHLPAIKPGASMRWVVTTSHRIPASARTLAQIGARPAVAVSGLQEPPDVAATVKSGASSDLLSVTVHNASGVTQYALPLYAVADVSGRTLAAGTTTISELGGGATRTVRIHLVGTESAAASIHVTASPTIFN